MRASVLQHALTVRLFTLGSIDWSRGIENFSGECYYLLLGIPNIESIFNTKFIWKINVT